MDHNHDTYNKNFLKIEGASCQEILKYAFNLTIDTWKGNLIFQTGKLHVKFENKNNDCNLSYNQNFLTKV